MPRGIEPIMGQINPNEPADRLSFIDCNSYFSSTLTVLNFITALTNSRVARVILPEEVREEIQWQIENMMLSKGRTITNFRNSS